MRLHCRSPPTHRPRMRPAGGRTTISRSAPGRLEEVDQWCWVSDNPAPPSFDPLVLSDPCSPLSFDPHSTLPAAQIRQRWKSSAGPGRVSGPDVCAESTANQVAEASAWQWPDRLSAGNHEQVADAGHPMEPEVGIQPVRVRSQVLHVGGGNNPRGRSWTVCAGSVSKTLVGSSRRAATIARSNPPSVVLTSRSWAVTCR
jgi:hypothetical protein